MGRGQVLMQVALPEPLHIVIAVPDLSLPTAAGLRVARRATRSLRCAEFTARAARLRTAVAGLREPRDLAALVENDLEPSVVLAPSRGGRAQASGCSLPARMPPP